MPYLNGAKQEEGDWLHIDTRRHEVAPLGHFGLVERVHQVCSHRVQHHLQLLLDRLIGAQRVRVHEEVCSTALSCRLLEIPQHR